MSEWDPEREAEELYRTAGFDPRHPPGPGAIAKRLLGRDAIREAPARFLPGDAALARVREKWRIYVRCDITPQRIGFALAHEIAEFHFTRTGYKGPDIEDRADRLGAAILAPRGAMAAAMEKVGARDFRTIARAFVSTESWAAMRTAEVAGAPLVLVSPERVRVRGQLSFPWGTDHEIRALAAKPRPGRGLQRARLTDDRLRVVLRVA